STFPAFPGEQAVRPAARTAAAASIPQRVIRLRLRMLTPYFSVCLKIKSFFGGAGNRTTPPRDRRGRTKQMRDSGAVAVGLDHALVLHAHDACPLACEAVQDERDHSAQREADRDRPQPGEAEDLP